MAHRGLLFSGILRDFMQSEKSLKVLGQDVSTDRALEATSQIAYSRNERKTGKTN